MHHLIDHFFLRRADRTHVQLVRYFLVAALSVAADFVAFFSLVASFRMHYLTAAVAAFAVWLVINYVLSVLWVFPPRHGRNRWMELLFFLGASLLGLAFNLAVLWVCTEAMGIHYAWSKIIATGASFLFNFVLRKLLLVLHVPYLDARP